MLTRHSRTFIDFNYCTLYNFWDFGEVDLKNVDFLVTQSKSKKKCIDIGRSRHFVRKIRFIHEPELQNRLKTFNYDQQMLKRVRNGSFCHFSFFFQPKYHKRWYRCGTAWRWRYHLIPEPCFYSLALKNFSFRCPKSNAHPDQISEFCFGAISVRCDQASWRLTEVAYLWRTLGVPLAYP